MSQEHTRSLRFLQFLLVWHAPVVRRVMGACAPPNVYILKHRSERCPPIVHERSIDAKLISLTQKSLRQLESPLSRDFTQEKDFFPTKKSHKFQKIPQVQVLNTLAETYIRRYAERPYVVRNISNETII